MAITHYDAENHLVRAAKTGLAVDYLYDPLGRRVKATGPSPTVRTLWAEDQEIADYETSAAPSRRYVPGPGIDQTLAVIDGATATRRYVHADRRGSTVALSKTTGGLDGGPVAYDDYGAPSTTLAAYPFLYRQALRPRHGPLLLPREGLQPGAGTLHADGPGGVRRGAEFV